MPEREEHKIFQQVEGDLRYLPLNLLERSRKRRLEGSGEEPGTMMEGTRSMEPPAAQFYTQRVGEVELIALSDGEINYPPP